jgi:hypothetical protein
MPFGADAVLATVDLAFDDGTSAVDGGASIAAVGQQAGMHCPIARRLSM